MRISYSFTPAMRSLVASEGFDIACGFVCSCQQNSGASVCGCGWTGSPARVRQIGRRVYLGLGQFFFFFFFNHQAIAKRNRGMEWDRDRERAGNEAGRDRRRDRKHYHWWNRAAVLSDPEARSGRVCFLWQHPPCCPASLYIQRCASTPCTGALCLPPPPHMLPYLSVVPGD